jgi:hypothetical protein
VRATVVEVVVVEPFVVNVTGDGKVVGGVIWGLAPQDALQSAATGKNNSNVSSPRARTAPSSQTGGRTWWT